MSRLFSAAVWFIYPISSGRCWYGDAAEHALRRKLAQVFGVVVTEVAQPAISCPGIRFQLYF